MHHLGSNGLGHLNAIMGYPGSRACLRRLGGESELLLEQWYQHNILCLPL